MMEIHTTNFMHKALAPGVLTSYLHVHTVVNTNEGFCQTPNMHETSYMRPLKACYLVGTTMPIEGASCKAKNCMSIIMSSV